MAKLTLKEWLDRLKANGHFKRNVRAWKDFPAQEGRFASFPGWIRDDVRLCFTRRGIDQLYSHQAESIHETNQGHHVCLVTPTASGKTLCYNLPVLNRILQHPETRALYVFPTKALAQDQMEEIHGLIGDLQADIGAFTYDGDTPDDARQAIRKQGHVVITNPDMLHAGILPHHTKWQKLFANLEFVVLDELHVYRGIFGSHVTNVIRRLRRICRFYGRDPLFICCSATIANPKDHAERLLELPVSLINESGAPRAKRTFILYNPPIVNRELGIRQSAMTPSRQVAGELVDNNIQTIIFATSRLNVEVLTKYLKDRFDHKTPAQKPVISGYRGGYLPNLRREIEEGLRKRELKGVVTTNALELGIDIGDLEACIMVGYPGSVASTWQQAGRAGRKKGESLALLVVRSSPLDQFIAEHPQYFFDQSPEHCRVNPDNLLILLHHLKSAAFELPFEQGETFGGENLKDMLDYLEEKNVLHRAGDRWHWSAESYPADEVSLRSINPENVVVVDETDGGHPKVIAEVDWDSAFTAVHEGAIYMMGSRQYHVDNLDLERKKAYVRQVDVDYYTDAMTYTHVRIIDRFEKKQKGPLTVEHGEVQVVRKVVGYKKIKFYTSENLGYGDVNLPEKDMHTTSYWFTMSRDLVAALPYNRAEIIDGLAGLAYTLHHLGAIFLMSETRDLDRSIGDEKEDWVLHRPGLTGRNPSGVRMDPSSDHDDVSGAEIFEPTIFLFDAYPGGIGFSELLYEKHDQLLSTARERIHSCPCQYGCPSCVGPSLEVGPTAKEVAGIILAHLLDDIKGG